MTIQSICFSYLCTFITLFFPIPVHCIHIETDAFFGFVYNYYIFHPPLFIVTRASNICVWGCLFLFAACFFFSLAASRFFRSFHSCIFSFRYFSVCCVYVFVPSIPFFSSLSRSSRSFTVYFRCFFASYRSSCIKFNSTITVIFEMVLIVLLF